MDAMNKSAKNELKIIVIGNSGTGKTSFVNKWTKDTFTDFYKATIVSEFSYKIFEYKGKFYRIQLWDLAGQDKNIQITKIFSKDAHGCIVLADITSKESIQDTLKWKASVDDTARFIDGGMLPCVLVENKIDLVDENLLKDDTEIKKFTEENKFDNFFKTSAKMGLGINECMDYLIKNMLERSEKVTQAGDNPFDKDRKSLVLKPAKEGQNGKNDQGGCC